MAGNIRKVLGLTLCMTVLFCVSATAAGEPLFRLDMDSLNLQKGASCNIAVSFENAQGAEIISIEGLENFDILSQSQGSTTSITGGGATHQEYRYFTVMPKTTGQFTLKANIRYKGQSYETNSLEVTIGEGSSSENESSARNLFIKTLISHSDAYLGEKIVLTYELYTRYSIENFAFTDYTAIGGVIAKDILEDQFKGEYVYLDGARYAKYEAKQLVLDPIRPGVYTIPSFNVQVNVITADSPGSIFGGGFGGMLSRSQPVYLQTEEKELTVKELPSEGKPANFSGVVGQLRLDSRYSREELNYGDSLTLQVTASGNCNLDGLKNIIPGGIPGFTVYETQKQSAESIDNSQYHVQKEYEAILVPEQTGVLDIAPILVPYFNPVTGKYENAEISGSAIEVLGDMPQQIIGGQQAAAVERLKIDQVSYATINDGYFSIQMSKQVLFGILIGLAFLLVLTVVLVWLFMNRKKQDSELKALYKQLMGANDVNEIYNLFNAMIKHCFNLSLKACSKNAVQNRLPNAALASQVTDIMDYMETHEEKANIQLKEKIRDVYRMIMSLEKTTARIA